MARIQLRLFAWVACLAVVGAGMAACRSAPNLPVGERTCLGFPPEVCRQQVEDLELEGSTHGGIVAYRIRCTGAICTADEGEGTVAVLFGDGTGREGGFGYAAPAGTPAETTPGPLPVTPACLGLPADWCDEFARAGAEEAADSSTITAITVRCTSSCTAAEGDGETVVTLADGTTRNLGWSYQSGD